MKKIAFMLISLYMGLMGANAQSNKYDLNDDEDVNITDVTLLVTKILDQNNGNEYDLNDDRDVNITDVILLVNYILNQNDNLICPDSHHPHMIDLGLPSGTKWACCNVGATKPEEYGGYYAWGETEEKECYNSVTYLYSTGVDEDGDGFYDDWHDDTGANGIWQNLGEISGTSYDVAHVKWGGDWCMPTKDDIKELFDNCIHQWTILNGVNGRRFTSKINGNSIFLPAAGCRNYGGLRGAGSIGDYWSSTQYWDDSRAAYDLYFGSDYVVWYEACGSHCGCSVRPVWKE